MVKEISSIMKLKPYMNSNQGCQNENRNLLPQCERLLFYSRSAQLVQGYTCWIGTSA